MDYILLKDKVGTMIKESRFIHSLGVAETARYLASRFGIDEEKAIKAGIYHDAYRYASDESSIPLLEENGFVIDEEERREPMLLHGALAALYYERDTGEKSDGDIEKAVRHHTLGSLDMTPLGGIIYIADYMEPGRKHLSDKDRIMILEKSTIEEMTALIIEKQRAYFESRGEKLAVRTEKLYSFIKDGGKL